MTVQNLFLWLSKLLIRLDFYRVYCGNSSFETDTLNFVGVCVCADPKHDTTMTFDGNKVIVPQGKPMRQPLYKDSNFSESEYLIYREDQCRIRYMLKLKFWPHGTILSLYSSVVIRTCISNNSCLLYMTNVTKHLFTGGFIVVHEATFLRNPFCIGYSSLHLNNWTS